MNSAEDNQEDSNSIIASISDVWYLKNITFDGRITRIITQNFNGPCSFIAICNILILREDLEILPPDRPTVTYEYLSQLLAEYLLTHAPDVDISAALSIMPYTCKGMDLNPVFTDVTKFRPSGPSGSGGLELFSHTGIPLVHGWLADPESKDFAALARSGDYDNSLNLIVEVDELTHGQFVVNYDDEPVAGPSNSRQNDSLTDGQRTKIEDAVAIRTFLDNTQSQLTYHGLFQLASSLAPNSLSALFRGSHLSVLYKASAADSESALYTLVTDQSFLHESSVVWEKVEDVDGGASTFVDSNLIKSSPAGGDYAGFTGESALAEIEAQAAAFSISDPVDEELARQLQVEEDEKAHEIYRRREITQERRRREQKEKDKSKDKEDQGPERSKRRKECIIM